MKRLCLVAVIILMAGCRLFPPPAEPYEEFALKGRFHVSAAEIKAAMIECGYSPISFGDPRPGKIYNSLSADEKLSPKVIRQECMFKKGFYFKDGWGGLCSIPSVRLETSACRNIPLRSRNNFYGE